jgi:hypothetical protein
MSLDTSALENSLSADGSIDNAFLPVPLETLRFSEAKPPSNFRHNRLGPAVDIDDDGFPGFFQNGKLVG